MPAAVRGTSPWTLSNAGSARIGANVIAPAKPTIAVAPMIPAVDELTMSTTKAASMSANTIASIFIFIKWFSTNEEGPRGPSHVFIPGCRSSCSC